MVKANMRKKFEFQTTVDSEKGASILQNGLIQSKADALVNVLLQIIGNLIDPNEGADTIKIRYKHGELLQVYGVGGKGFSEEDVVRMNSIFVSGKNAEGHGMYGTGKIAATALADSLHYYSSSQSTEQDMMVHLEYSVQTVADVIAAGATGMKRSVDIIAKTAEVAAILPKFGTYVVFEGIHWKKYNFPVHHTTLANWLVEKIPESLAARIYINDEPLPQRVFANEHIFRSEEIVPGLGRVEVTIGFKKSPGQPLYFGGKFAQVEVGKFFTYLKEENYCNLLHVYRRPEICGIISADVLAKYRSSESFGTLKHEFSSAPELINLVEYLYKVGRKIEKQLLSTTDMVSSKDETIKNSLQKTLESVYGKQAPVNIGSKGSKREFTLTPANLILEKGEKALINIIAPDPDQVDCKKIKGIEARRIDSKTVEITAGSEATKIQIPFVYGEEQIFAHVSVVEEKKMYITPAQANVAAGEVATFRIKNMPEENTSVQWVIDNVVDNPLFLIKTQGDMASIRISPSTKDNIHFPVSVICNGIEISGSEIVVKESTKKVTPLKIADRHFYIKALNVTGANYVAIVNSKAQTVDVGDGELELYPIQINLSHPIFSQQDVAEEVYTCIIGSIVNNLIETNMLVVASPIEAVNRTLEMVLDFKMKLASNKKK